MLLYFRLNPVASAFPFCNGVIALVKCVLSCTTSLVHLQISFLAAHTSRSRSRVGIFLFLHTSDSLGSENLSRFCSFSGTSFPTMD